MTDQASSAVGVRKSVRQAVHATLIHADTSLAQVILTGPDSDRFAKIRQLVGGSVTAVILDDQDGPAATGWIDDDAVGKGLPRNPVASVVADREILGLMIVTGLGQGETECLNSIHAGLQRVLETISRQHSDPPLLLSS